MPVTRVEIVEHIGEVFAGLPIPRDELLALACRRGARPALLRVLEGLPDGSFRNVRELWPALPGVPIERGFASP